MRQIFVIGAFAALASLPACTHISQSNDTESQLIVEALFNAFNRHDSRAIAALYAEDGRLITPEQCEPIVGRAAISSNYQTLFDEIPDVNDTVTQMVIDGETVAVAFTASSQIEGAAFELPIAAFLKIRDGLIIEDVAYFDAEMAPQCE